MNTSMLDFVREGAFGSIRIGLTREELKGYLGEPLDWQADTLKDRAAIWRYGNIEFHFNKQIVSMIFCDQVDLSYGGPTLGVDPWMVQYGQPRLPFENALSNVQIPFVQTTLQYDSSQRIVVAESGVRFLFIEEPEDALSPSGLVAWWMGNMA